MLKKKARQKPVPVCESPCNPCGPQARKPSAKRMLIKTKEPAMTAINRDALMVSSN